MSNVPHQKRISVQLIDIIRKPSMKEGERMSDRARSTDRRARYTQEAIRRSLLALMKQKNFRRITVTEVCRAAEINRGTFYLHYVDLDDVLDELLTEMMKNSTTNWISQLDNCRILRESAPCPRSTRGNPRPICWSHRL